MWVLPRSLRLTLPLILLVAGGAQAQDIKRLEGAGDWRAYAFQEKGNPVCYMVSEPKKDEGNYSRRGDIYLMVTHRPAEKSTDVVNVVAGYDYRTDSEVEVKVDSDVFDLFTHKDTAWAPTEDEDRRLVQAMIKGKTMVIRGTSSRGTDTKDTYSLIGFTRAYNSINKACGR